MNLARSGLRLSSRAPVDLHLHTIHSDGRWLPEELLDHLRREQFGLAAIADHDRTDTALAIQQLAEERGLPIVAAAEMSSTWRGEMTDLLCIGFDPGQSPLGDLAQGLLQRQQENTREAYQAIKRRGCTLPKSPSALAELLAQPSAQQPWALVALLEHLGYGQEAGEIAQQAGCSFATNDLAEVVEAAHRSGAVCLIAHPGHPNGFLTYDEKLLDLVRQEAPIDGLEVYHPRHSPSQRTFYLDYARRHDLLIGAGSDSHGPDQPPIKYPAGLVRELLDRLGVQVQ